MVAVLAEDLEPLVLLPFCIPCLVSMGPLDWMPQLQLFWCPYASLGSREASGSVPLMLLCLAGIKNLCVWELGKLLYGLTQPLTLVWVWTNHLLLDLPHRDVVGVR